MDNVVAIFFSLLSLIISISTYNRDRGKIKLSIELFWTNVFSKKNRELSIIPFVECNVVNIGRRTITIEDVYFEWSKGEKLDFPFQKFLLKNISSIPKELSEGEIFKFCIDPIYFGFMLAMYDKKYKHMNYMTVLTSRGSFYRKKIKKNDWLKIIDSINSASPESKKRLEHLLTISKKTPYKSINIKKSIPHIQKND